MVAVTPRPRSRVPTTGIVVATAAVADEDRPRMTAAFALVMAGLATVGMTGIRAGGWTISDFLFSGASLAIGINLWSGARSRVAPRRARQTSPSLLIGLMLLTLGGLLAAMLRSLDPLGSALTLVRLWYITVVWFWTIRSVSTSLRSFQRLLLAAIAGAVFHAGYGIFQELSGANAVAPHWGRSPGFSDHFGDLAFSIATLLPLVAAWPARTSGRRAEVLRALAVAVMLGGIGSTGSMTLLASGLIGVVVALNLPRLLGATRRTRRRVAVPLLTGGLVVLTLSLGVVELSIFDRLSELTQSDSGTRWSANSRFDMTQVAIDGAVQSPLVGVGLDETSGSAANNFSGESISNMDTLNIHSMYLRLLFEAGILALLGFLLILFVVFRDGVLLTRLVRGSSVTWLPSALVGCAAAACVGGAFSPIIYGRTVWLPAALLSALGGLAKAGLLDVYKPTAAAAPAPRVASGMRR